MLSKVFEYFIKKPILNHILLLFLLVVGFLSYSYIPKEIFPNSVTDKIVVDGFYAGASNSVLDKLIVNDIEDDVRVLADVESLKTRISNGSFEIIISLKDGVDKRSVLEDIKDIVSQKKINLPSDMNDPIVKNLRIQYPLLEISLGSKTASKEDLIKFAKKIKDEILKVEGVGEASIWNDSDFELKVVFDENKLKAYNLNSSDVIMAVSSLSSIFPVGYIKEKNNHLLVSTKNGIKDVNLLFNTSIQVGGRYVYIGDIANVSFVRSEVPVISSFNMLPSVSISVSKTKESDAIKVSKNIKNIVNELKEKNEIYQLEVHSDTSVFIRNRLNTVMSNIIFGVILLSFAIGILVNPRISFVVTIGIPVSFFSGIIFIYFAGYSLNMLSLLGVLIALGMIVDEAIVVSENIYRHLEEGKGPLRAAVDGASEVFPAVLSATLTTVFAFLPLLVLSGEMGIFVRVLPIVISILLLTSLVEAFVFLPLHSKDFLKKTPPNKFAQKIWDSQKKVYIKILNYLFLKPKTFLYTFLIFSILSTFFLFTKMPFHLFPKFDTTQVFVTGKVNINTTIEETHEKITKIEKALFDKLNKETDVQSIVAMSGFKLNAKFETQISPNNFHIFINLYESLPDNFFDYFITPYLSPSYDDSLMKRRKTSQELLGEVQSIISQLNLDFEEISVVSPSAGVVESDIEILVGGDDKKIALAIDRLVERLKQIDGVYNINDNRSDGIKELKIGLNKYGESLGFNEESLFQVLKPYFFDSEVSKMFYKDELIKVRTQSKEKDFFESFKNFSIKIPSQNKYVELHEIITFDFIDSSFAIYKENGLRNNIVYASINPELTTSSDVMDKITSLLEEFKNDGVHVEIKGEEQQNAKIQKEMSIAMIIAFFAILITLIWMFDSILLSLVIVSVIPLSMLGVLIGHLIMGISLSLPSFLGIVGLAGVVVNDGIIMISFLKDANSKKEVLEKAITRLRPIILTSLTTLLGLFSLMFFASGQATLLQPMAISLGFGILWATVINLLFVPILFVKIRRLS